MELKVKSVMHLYVMARVILNTKFDILNFMQRKFAIFYTQKVSNSLIN